MKSINSFLQESYSRNTDPNYVVSSFPIGRMKVAIDDAYGSNVDINVQDDIVEITDEDFYIHITIERIPKKIVCTEEMKNFLIKELNFDKNDFVD